jgi:hypothetical protein
MTWILREQIGALQLGFSRLAIERDKKSADRPISG